MNLQEQTNRIHQMMGVISENKIIDLINDLGLYDAIRYFGSYDKVKKLMGDYKFSEEEKIRFIKDAIEYLGEEYNPMGFSVYEVGGEPIFYRDSDDYTERIVYFGPDYVTINVYGRDNVYSSSFTEKYEYLDDETLDKVFLFMVDVLKHNK